MRRSEGWRGRRFWGAAFWGLAALAVCAAGCNQKENKKEVAPVAPSPRFREDAALSGFVDELLQKCTVDAGRGLVECPDDTYRRKVRELSSGERGEKAKNLEPLLALLLHGDDKKDAVVASLLHDVARGGLSVEGRRAAVATEVASGLREQLLRLKPVQARQVAPVATHAAALSGTLAELLAAVSTVPTLEAAVLRHGMIEGRLSAFAAVQRAVGEGSSGARLAALEAPRNMGRWSQQDRAAICPWALPLLDDTRPLVPERAAALLVNCPGPGMEALVARAERLAKELSLGPADIPPLRELCTRTGPDRLASPEQCERNRALLNSLVRQAKAPRRTRALALAALGYQWPDAKTLELAKKYLTDADVDLAAQAKITSEMLTRRLGAKPKPA